MLTHPIATLMNRFGLASPTRHLPGIPCTSAVFQQPFFKTESARYTRRAVALPDGRRFLNPFQIHGKDLVFMTGLARRCAVQKVLDEQGVSLTPVSLGFGQTAMGVAITDFSANFTTTIISLIPTFFKVSTVYLIIGFPASLYATLFFRRALILVPSPAANITAAAFLVKLLLSILAAIFPRHGANNCGVPNHSEIA